MKRTIALALTAAWSLLGVTASLADGGANHQIKQTPPIKLGTSGGSVADISKAFCCGGTLGSLVMCGKTSPMLSILSNNHVLGRSGSASTGEDDVQPGLIDTGCRSTTSNSNVVGDFAGNLVPLGMANVDAAISSARSGMVDTTGAILDIGVPCATPKTATPNMSVAKSGRTSGFTTGTVQAVNVNVSVQYQTGCNSGKKFTVSYVNQVTVTPGTFLRAGDSGSLMVTNDGNYQPAGLLFAGSSSVAVANPIQDVIAAFEMACGGPGTFSFVGGTCASTTTSTSTTSPTSAQVSFATSVKDRHAPALMSHGAIIGVGVGAADEDPSEAVIVLYVDQGRARPALPEALDGVRVKVVLTDPIVAFSGIPYAD